MNFITAKPWFHDLYLLLVAGKGFWAEMLGVGDFYYELGVKIIEVCLATSHRNGGTHYISVWQPEMIKVILHVV